MRILVTGHRGYVGGPVADHLQHLGHDVIGFDRADGDDLLDLAAVRRAADDCPAIVHLGALAHDTAGSPEDIMAVNVLGTWHVLLAAEAAGIGRVVHFSSAQVFGTAEGERLPDYLPVDDAHPRRAMRAYGLSKCLAEDLCAGFTARTSIPTVSLRPVWIWDPGMYQRIEAQWRADPRSEWTPFWSTAHSSTYATSPRQSSKHLPCHWPGITAFCCAPPTSQPPNPVSISPRGLPLPCPSTIQPPFNTSPGVR